MRGRQGYRLKPRRIPNQGPDTGKGETMQLNGHEIDFDYTRVQDAENLTKAARGLAEKTEAAQKAVQAGWGDSVKESIAMYRDYLETATGKDILEDCDNIDTAEEAYFCFLAEVQGQKEAYEQRRAERIAKYEKLKGKL